MTQDITDLLIAERAGDPEAIDQLMPLVYPELKRIAHGQLGGHKRGALLDTTALVHELYLRLVDQTRVQAVDRVHFYSLSARVMRQIIVDHARRRKTLRRGGDLKPVSLDAVQVAVESLPDVVLAVDRALEDLDALDKRLATVFECRYFLGMTENEVADALDISLRTSQRDWLKSRAWLQVKLGGAIEAQA